MLAEVLNFQGAKPILGMGSLSYLFNEMQLDIDKFSRKLMSKLKGIYIDENNLAEFGKRMYQLWQYLPKEISEEEPFYILSYADDPLSWGDEKQCRELYEKAIYYYDIQ